MVAQDTGSAIVGPARADLYWGAGDDAGKIAGRIRQQGRFVMLMPRSLDMVEAGRKMPLPRAKPAIPTEVASKTNGKSDKTDGGKSENNKSESTKSGSAKPESAKSESAKPENGKSGEAKSKAGRSKPGL